MRCAPHSALISSQAHAPDLLRIGLEEGEIELAAEAVDEEVFETFLRAALMEARFDVADADLSGARECRAC